MSENKKTIVDNLQDKNNGKKSRKELIKTLAIVFLSIMLVLTLFSNTILNYSLPEVSAQYMTYDTITAKIRGTGTVESLDPYEVKATQTRVVESVSVKSGDIVEKGDVLFLLADSESAELEEAQKALDDMMLQFETALLTGEISNQVFQNAQNSNTSTTQEYQNKINTAQTTIDTVQGQVTNLNTQMNNLDQSISLLPYGDEAKKVSAAESALEAAKKTLENATAKLSTLKEELQTVLATIEGYQVDVSGNVTGTVTREQYDNAVARKQVLEDTEIPKAESSLKSAKNNVTKKEAELSSAQNVYKEKENNLAVQKITLSSQLQAANNNLEKAREEKQKLVSNISQELALSSQNDALAEQMEKVQKLREESVGSQIVAPISGTVTGVTIIAGSTMNADQVLATILPEGKGFSLSMSVTKEQAKRVSVGDVADIQNSWYYSDVTAVLINKKVDPQNPAQNQLLTFEITGDVTAGQSLSLSVGQKSSSYDSVVPNSAIREDSNGKFVLIVKAKNSPLGNRYFAERADVQVLASDDTKSAISGAFEGYEYVITTSNKPIESGQQIRLAD